MSAADFTQIPAAAWWVAVYLGVVTTAGTFFLLQLAILRIPPGKVMAYTYLIPSWVLLHEWGMGQGAFGLIYVGVALTLLALVLLLLTNEG